jgi:hypothetical protein
MKSGAFTDERGEGFVLDRSRSDSIQGKFFEKFIFSETTYDPFGGAVSYERITYRSVGFSFYSTYPEITLIDPPRSVKSMMRLLAELLDFSVAISDLRIEPLRWANAFGETNAVMPTVTSMELGDLALDENAVAKILLSGAADVQAAANRLVGGRLHTVDRVQARVVIDDQTYPLVLSSDGSARLPDNVPAAVVGRVREKMPKGLDRV